MLNRAITVVCALSTVTSLAHADNLRVVVDAEGRPFRVIARDGSAISRACAEPCAITVAPGEYTVAVADHEESVLIDGSGTLRYRPASPRVRLTSGVVAVAGVFVTGVAVYGALKICSRTYRPELGRDDRPCEDGPSAERYTTYNRVLLATAGVSFTAAVVAGFVFFASGPSVRFIGSEGARATVLPVAFTNGGGLAVVGTF